MKKTIAIFFSFVLLLSCTVQKRKYQKGFYVTWKHATEKEKTVEKKDVKIVKASVSPPALVTEKVQTEPELAVASAKMGSSAGILKSQPPLSVLHKDDPCDNVIFKDGTEVKARVIEINSSEIKYRKCDAAGDGPLYVVKKSDIFMIKYANGTKEVFKSEPNSVQQNNSNNNGRPQPYNGRVRIHPMAILSVVAGILGIYPFTGLFSIIALILARYAKKEIALHPDVYTGENTAHVGKVLGIVGLVIVGIALLMILIILSAI